MKKMWLNKKVAGTTSKEVVLFLYDVVLGLHERLLGRRMCDINSYSGAIWRDYSLRSVILSGERY